MPILASEIKFYLTGGAANVNPDASLGGAISGTEVTSGAVHNLFDKVTGDQSSAGHVDYRCLAVKNTNASLTWEAVKVFIAANTPAGDHIDIGVETPQAGAVQVVPGGTTAPADIAFSSPDSRPGGLDGTGEGDVAGEAGPDKWFAVWVRRTVPPGTAAYNYNTATITVSGDTPA